MITPDGERKYVRTLPDARHALADEIRREGRALVASSGLDALSMLSDLPELTAVVTDSHLGDGPGGMEILRAARARHPRCIRVLVTASPDVFMSDDDTSLVDTIFGKP